MTADDSKSYLPYLIKLVDKCNTIYHHYVNKNSINRDYTAFSEKN